MAGMYPTDTSVTILGESLMFPGMGKDGKFTNGNFSDPSEKPSHLPAQTINLILDNISALIEKLGSTPNNESENQLADLFSASLNPHKAVMRDSNGRIEIAAPDAKETGNIAVNAAWVNRGFSKHFAGKYEFLSFEPSPFELLEWRLLPLQYQIIEIESYKELCERKWVGEALNATAYFWYKCDENGARNANGLFMRVEDSRGLFYRASGENAVFKAENNTPYNGGSIGQFIKDAIRNIKGGAIQSFQHGTFPVWGAYSQEVVGPIGGADGTSYRSNITRINFDASRVVSISHENCPASISYYVCITY